MRKLLQINVELNYGSTGKIAEEIGQLAIDQGWQSYIAYGRHSNDSKSIPIKIGNNCDSYYHVLQTRLFDRQGLASKKATINLVKRIIEISPSIIHLHNLHGYYLNLEVLFSFLSKSKIPVIWTLHDCWAMTGHCTHFEHVGCYKWQVECQKCPQLSTYPTSLFRDRSKKNYQLKKKFFNMVPKMTLVTVSKWLQSVVRESYLADYATTVIYNGIDTTKFSPSSTTGLRDKYNLKDKYVILGVASVWSKNKGLEDFLKLNSLLRSDEVIVLIGLNEKQKRRLPENIIGFDRTRNQHELVEWYSLADIFINTSVEESFGLTTVEAMSCGTPVIAYNSTANPEMVNEKVGFIVKKNDIDAIRESLDHLRKNPGLDYTLNCRRRVGELFRKQDRYKEYLDLYTSLL